MFLYPISGSGSTTTFTIDMTIILHQRMALELSIEQATKTGLQEIEQAWKAYQAWKTQTLYNIDIGLQISTENQPNTT